MIKYLIHSYNHWKKILKTKKYKHLLAGGKEIRESEGYNNTKSSSQNKSLLSLYGNDLKTFVNNEHVNNKTNKVPVFQELIPFLIIKKSIFTAVDLHTQRRKNS